MSILKLISIILSFAWKVYELIWKLIHEVYEIKIYVGFLIFDAIGQYHLFWWNSFLARILLAAIPQGFISSFVINCSMIPVDIDSAWRGSNGSRNHWVNQQDNLNKIFNILERVKWINQRSASLSPLKSWMNSRFILVKFGFKMFYDT